ncbi:MAG: DNA translocase FtsK [Candidatus Omnitrophota bacterium]
MKPVRKNEIIAVILFASGVLLFLSIFTFTDQDHPFYTSHFNTSAQNAVGIMGVYIGGVLRFIVGKAAYVLPLLVFVWSFSRFFQIEQRKVYFKMFGTLILMSAVSASLSMISGVGTTTAFSQGGLVGYVTSEFLVGYLGNAGSAVFVVSMIILSVLIATEFLLFPVFMSLFRAGKSFPEKLKGVLKERERPALVSGKKEKTNVRQAKENIAKKLEEVKRQVEEARNASISKKPALKDKKEMVVTSSSDNVPVKKKKIFIDSRERVKKIASSSEGVALDYKLPSTEMLNAPVKTDGKVGEEDLKVNAAMLEKTLLEFGVEAKVTKINRGPVITMYELEPSVGTKVSRITSLADNIALAMRSSNIRIVAPLPGKGTIGVEIPNKKSELVLLRDIMESDEYQEETSPLKFALGKDISGRSIITDLVKMPHLLIAGATGAGKTVCLNSVITSFLVNSSPDELKFIMIDPKRVEMMIFEGIPHLAMPIVTNPKKAAAALNWVVTEMERRYEVFAEMGVRNLALYREKKTENDETIPYIVVIVDELADLIVVAQQDVEGAIMRIAQLARAAGIHLILATQRPSVNVITGVIKANFPARISFQVASKVDSRTVLDANGAEKLLGRGDMLFMEPGSSHIIRGQCCLVDDAEIKKVVKYIKDQSGANYIESALAAQEKKAHQAKDQEKDDLYREAVEIVIQTKQASVSMIQRKLRVGYSRAARMIDIMEEDGIVGPYNGSKAREILIDDIQQLMDV